MISNSHLPHLASMAFVVLLLASCDPSPGNDPLLTEADKREIEEAKRNVPIQLANEGWEVYESIFPEDYVNWPMDADKIRTRDEFLGRIKKWYDDGNRPVANEVTTIDFVPISNNIVLLLSSQAETFNDPNDSTQRTTIEFRSVNVFKKKNGNWRSHFTAFLEAKEYRNKQD